MNTGEWGKKQTKDKTERRKSHGLHTKEDNQRQVRLIRTITSEGYQDKRAGSITTRHMRTSLTK